MLVERSGTAEEKGRRRGVGKERRQFLNVLSGKVCGENARAYPQVGRDVSFPPRERIGSNPI